MQSATKVRPKCDHKVTNFGVVKKKNPRRVCSTRVFSTQSRGRTGTGVNLLVFETSASTDSAIWASDISELRCKYTTYFSNCKFLDYFFRYFFIESSASAVYQQLTYRHYSWLWHS